MMTALNLDNLPSELFDHIMFLLGRDSLESLESCRKVNSAWNKRIMNSQWDYPSKKWGPIIGRQFERSWDINLPSEEIISKAVKLEADGILPAAVMESLAEKLRIKLGAPSLQEIRCAASLAHKGRLGSVGPLWLWGDLSSVPAQNLAPLVACVTWLVRIDNVRGCDLVGILESVRSKELDITRQTLDSDKTEALVQSMESVVETLWLGFNAEGLESELLTLSIATLTQYSGQGKCREVRCDHNIPARYREQLVTWAKSKDWDVIDNRDRIWLCLR